MEREREGGGGGARRRRGSRREGEEKGVGREREKTKSAPTKKCPICFFFPPVNMSDHKR